MNKTDYLCRLIRHAANVPVERIQLNEFVPAREALNSRVPSLAALAENEVRTAVQAYAGLLHVISTIKTHYIVLPTQELDHPDRSVPLLGAGVPASEEHPARSGVLGRSEHGYPDILQLGRKGR